MRDWPETIFERDKERRVRILKYVKDKRRRRSQKGSRPFGESQLWPEAALFLSHIAGAMLPRHALPRTQSWDSQSRMLFWDRP